MISTIALVVKHELLDSNSITEDERHILENFEAGQKYVSLLLKRRELKSIGLHGEAADGDAALRLPSTINRLAELDRIIGEYEPKNIFNMDETGIFYRCLPNRTYVLEKNVHRKNVRGTKSMKDKSRLSGIVCTSSTGDKVKLAAIGKSKQPRCWK